MDAKKHAGEICVVLSAVLFGMMPLFTKAIAAHGGNAYMSALGRFAFGSLMLLALALLHREVSLKISLRQLWEIFPLSLLYALTPVLLFSSYGYMDTGLATTLHFTFPVAVIAISALLFHARPDGKQIFCAVLCAAGVSQLAPGGTAEATGILLAVLSGLTYALYVVLLGRSHLQSLSVLTMAFWLSLFSSAEIGTAAVMAGEFSLSMDASGWGAMLLLALSATVLALALFQKGLFACGAVKASLLSTFEPLTSVWIGCLVFREALTAKTMLGILCVLAAGALLVLPFPIKKLSPVTRSDT